MRARAHIWYTLANIIDEDELDGHFRSLKRLAVVN